ncbi:MAG: transcriptional repressor [Acidimicrobiia bacterium]|nr:transcriptional repressor [Acidimicrobiia bacterium]
MTTSQLDQQIRARLAAHDVRYTTGRQRVVAALMRADGPRSAAELHADLRRSLPLSSLYRSLSVMSDAEVLSPHHGTKGITRYELAEWLMGHHHHLVCIDCGAVDDVELSGELEATLEQLVSQAAGAGDFTATGHALEIDGRCAACS